MSADESFVRQQLQKWRCWLLKQRLWRICWQILSALLLISLAGCLRWRWLKWGPSWTLEAVLGLLSTILLVRRAWQPLTLFQAARYLDARLQLAQRCSSLVYVWEHQAQHPWRGLLAAQLAALLRQRAVPGKVSLQPIPLLVLGALVTLLAIAVLVPCAPGPTAESFPSPEVARRLRQVSQLLRAARMIPSSRQLAKLAQQFDHPGWSDRTMASNIRRVWQQLQQRIHAVQQAQHLLATGASQQGKPASADLPAGESGGAGAAGRRADEQGPRSREQSSARTAASGLPKKKHWLLAASRRPLQQHQLKRQLVAAQIAAAQLQRIYLRFNPPGALPLTSRRARNARAGIPKTAAVPTTTRDSSSQAPSATSVGRPASVPLAKISAAAAAVASRQWRHTFRLALQDPRWDPSYHALIERYYQLLKHSQQEATNRPHD